jgi:hypothetical protein
LAHAAALRPLPEQCEFYTRLFCRRLLAEPLWYTVCQTTADRFDSKVEAMAIDTSGGHPAMDYPEHVRTYSGFLRATLILIALVVVVLLFLLTRVP